MSEKTLSSFQKSFLSRVTGETLYNQREFDEALAVAKAQIMQIAIETTKTAIAIERQECAKVADEMIKGLDVDTPIVLDVALEQLAEKIRNRLNKS